MQEIKKSASAVAGIPKSQRTLDARDKSIKMIGRKEETRSRHKEPTNSEGSSPGKRL